MELRRTGQFPVKIIPMSLGGKKILLVAVLLVMPLHGAAVTLADMLCDLGGQTHQIPANGGHDRDVHQNSDQDKGNTDAHTVWHPFHGTVLGGVTAALLAPAQDFLLWALAPDAPHGLFVPERPQRPPLA